MTRGQIARHAMIVVPLALLAALATAGVAFVFWPIIASMILGTVIGIGTGVDCLDRRLK